MTYPFKNLVFEGGGVKGIAYAGAISVLEDKNILSQIDKVAGTSAGAITAALVSLRYSAPEIKTIIDQTDFASFEDHKNDLRVLTKYGIYRGEAFLDWMTKQITNKGFAADATFADLAAKGCRDLNVFATDLNMHDVQRFSAETTPTTIVAQAVRASMSIPLFFEAWQFPNKIPNDHIFVDGGTVYNYPINAFDPDGGTNVHTLGFHLDNLDGPFKDDGLEYDHLFKYIKNLFETLLNAQVIDFDKNPDAEKRTVRLNDHGIKATDFNLSAADKTKLYNSGVKYTTEYLEKYTPEA